jgi:hypothetical protein
MVAYPSWSYFPRNTRPPEWAEDLVQVTLAAKDLLDSRPAPEPGVDRTSDGILANLRPGLESLGYKVETGKTQARKITRPVLFGDDGRAEVSYDIDAFHDDHGIAVEVEAGRGAANNADYRDIVRTALLLDANFLALFMPIAYHSGRYPMPAYANTRRQLEAIYASRRLRLPFDGILLIGY